MNNENEFNNVPQKPVNPNPEQTNQFNNTSDTFNQPGEQQPNIYKPPKQKSFSMKYIVIGIIILILIIAGIFGIKYIFGDKENSNTNENNSINDENLNNNSNNGDENKENGKCEVASIEPNKVYKKGESIQYVWLPDTECLLVEIQLINVKKGSEVDSLGKEYLNNDYLYDNPNELEYIQFEIKYKYISSNVSNNVNDEQKLWEKFDIVSLDSNRINVNDKSYTGNTYRFDCELNSLMYGECYWKVGQEETVKYIGRVPKGYEDYYFHFRAGTKQTHVYISPN